MIGKNNDYDQEDRFIIHDDNYLNYLYYIVLYLLIIRDKKRGNQLVLLLPITGNVQCPCFDIPPLNCMLQYK